MCDPMEPHLLFDGEEVFLDTSVVLNRVHREVETNRGSAELYSCEQIDMTLGSTVVDEINRRIDVRKMVYRDMSAFINNSSKSDDDDVHIVYKYDVCTRDAAQELDLTDHDITHIRNLQHHVASDCDKPAYILRKYNRMIKKRCDSQIQDYGTFENTGDEDLARDIGDRIQNHSDGKVLSQAVKWKHVRENNEGVTVEAVISDDRDMHTNEDEINEEITDHNSRFSTLKIIALTEFLEDDGN